MSFLSRVRHIARPMARRASSWEALSRAMPASKQAEFNASVAAFKKRKDKAASAAEGAGIDFDQYVDVLGADEVAAIRKEYEAFQYTDFETEKKAELAAVREELAKVVAAIEAEAANMSDAAAKASEELRDLQRTRTTLETTMADVLRQFPEMAAELDERLDNEDWDTASKPLDVTAMRLKAIEDNWDASTLGSLDENTQKEFLDEIAALETAGDADDVASQEPPEYLMQYISEWHDILGVPEDKAAMKAFVKANRVTEADLAIKNERVLWEAIDMATELGQANRARGLMAHAKALRAAGEVEVDMAWREKETRKLTTARRHQEYNSIPTAAELEGKSAEELEAMANEAADNLDFYRASHIMYAARVASGDIDTEATDLDSFSGFSNHFFRRSQEMTRTTA